MNFHHLLVASQQGPIGHDRRTQSESQQNPASDNQLGPSFAIGLLDPTGREFYVSSEGPLVSYKAGSTPQPLLVSTAQLKPQLVQLSQQYPPTCKVFAIAADEFYQRVCHNS
jgi:hypothetical protein